jgi:hypothetical protein
MYIASLTAGEIVSRLPVIRADAMAPTSPDRLARMRRSIASRKPSMNAAQRSHALAGVGGSAPRIAPKVSPVAPMP